MRKCLLATVVLVAPFFTSPAHAQDSGFFARGSVGSCELNNAYAPFSNNNEAGFGVGLGGRVLTWLAVEPGNNRLGEFQFNSNFYLPRRVCTAVPPPPL